MSLKMKLTASISAFFLVVGLMLIGIMAVNQATVNMGGSISFTATDVYARVTGSIENAQGEYADKELPTLEFSAENGTPDQSEWSGLNLLFDDDATPIVIKVTVENLSAQNTLRVNLNDTLSSTVENLEKVVKNDGEDYTNQTDITLQPNGQENDSTTFTITMSVIDKNTSLTADFDYKLNLFDQYYVPQIYDYFTFEENGDGTVELTAFDEEKAPSTDIVIPATVSQNESGEWIEGDTYAVTSIGETAFRGKSLNSLTVPDSIQYIGSSAFSGVTIATINFNANLENVTSGLFNNAQVDIINIGANVKNIPAYFLTAAYHNGHYVKKVYFMPNSQIEEIVDNAFTATNSTSSGLTEVDLSNCTSLTSIGDDAFSYCYGLTSITLPSRLTSIGTDAFYGCSGLTSITLPSSLTSIGDRGFQGCGLTEVDLSNCTNLTSIGEKTFYNCSGLTSITLPSSLTSIGDDAFYGCSALTEINYNAVSVSDLKTSNGVFSYAGQDGDGITVNFGEGVETIPAFLFYPYFNVPSYAPNIKVVNFSSTVTSIGNYAFQYCSGLTEVDLSNCTSLTSIGSYAFNDCSGLTEVDLSSCTSLTSIGEWAFNGCSGLTSITLPSSLTSIGNYAFQYCSGLTEVDLSNCISLTSIKSYAFYNCSGLTSITLPSSLTNIGWSAFYYCSGLTEVDLSNCTSLTSIGEQTFYNCSGLTELDLSNCTSLTSIGDMAFAGCSGLTSITLPSSLTSIGEKTFYNCSGLTSITLPSSLTSIGDYAFSGCTGLTEVDLSNCTSLISIRERAFYNCSGLTELDLSNCTSLTSIGEWAFYNCSGLTSITLPSSLTNIGWSAFYDCSGLTTIRIEATTPPTLGNSAIPSNVTTIEVPSASVDAYRSASGWSSYADEIVGY